MLHLDYDYASCVKHSEKVAWTVDEVMPLDTRLDFTRPFLPEALSADARVVGQREDARYHARFAARGWTVRVQCGNGHRFMRRIMRRAEAGDITTAGGAVWFWSTRLLLVGRTI